MTKYNSIHTIRISLICNPPETKPRSYTGLRPHGGGDRCDHGGIDQWHHPASDPTAAMLFQNGGSYTKLLPVLYNGYLWKYDMYNIWCIYILYILYIYIWYVLYIYPCTYRCTYILHVLRSDLFLSFTTRQKSTMEWIDHFRRGNLSRRSTDRSYVC